MCTPISNGASLLLKGAASVTIHGANLNHYFFSVYYYYYYENAYLSRPMKHDDELFLIYSHVIKS